MENKIEKLLLQDNFIELNEDNDELGNVIYIEELINVIKSSTTNDNTETIALIGSWGSGKSSIVSGLEKKLVNTKLNDKSVKFIKYNAWKYNNDSFRKTFLIDSTEDEVKKKELEDKLYNKTTRIDFEVNRKYRRIIAVSTIIIIVVMLVMSLISIDDKKASDFFLDILSKLMTLALIESLGSIILRKIIVEKEITIEKEFSPEEFSRDFVKVTKGNKYFSIYVIDDLDRCDPNQTLEILDTIQGYLKTDNINGIFIIPVDKERLIKILSDQRGYNNKDCVEYFSKIFDVMVEIKTPGTLNLFNMLKNLSTKYRFNLSNFSMSILSDFLIKTPRDIKKHLNNIRLKTNVLKRQKISDYIEESVFMKEEYDSFIKIYIIESRWPEFYMWLVENFKKYNIDSIDQIKDNYECLDDDLVSFLERSRSTSIKDIYSYHHMKDEGMNIDEKLVNIILKGDTYTFEDYLENNEANIIENFEYTYHIYIEERNLFDQYFPYLFKIYLSILNINNDCSLSLLKSKIKLDSIMMNLDTYLSIPNNEEVFAENLLIFSKELLMYASTDNLNSKFIEVFNNYVRVLIQINSDTMLFNIIEDSKILTNKMISKDNYMEAIELIIRKDKDYINDYANLISVELIEFLGEKFDIVFEVALENSNLSFILESISKSPNIGSKYMIDIVELLEIKSKLGRNYNSFSADTLVKDIQQIKIMNILLDNDPNTLFNLIEKDIILTYIPQIISIIKRNKSDETINIMKELAYFYYKIASTTDNWKLLYEFVDNLDMSTDSEIITSILNFSIEKECKNELYILLLNKNYDKQIFSDYLKFLNIEKDLELLENWIDLIKYKNDVTMVNPCTETKINMRYTHFVNNLLKLFFKLDDLYLDVIFDYIDMSLVVSDPTYQFISDLKKSSPLINKLIRRISSVDQYEKMIKILSKKSNRVSSYHKATENIVSSVKNVDELLDINHNTNLKLDPTDKNIIRNKVEESYSQEKEKFTDISWKY